MIDGKKIIAIIPVRGGSKGIPHKNMRLLAGKPLLSYTIQTCKKSQFIDEVYVSTECPNLKDLAMKFGARIVHRPIELASDEIGLDEVITDAVSTIEKQNCAQYDYLISVQATSPLISTESIDSAIQKCVQYKYDTVLSVVGDNHLRWQKDKNGSCVPLYEKRVNRQFLSNTFKETGGFVVFQRELLKQKTRFGRNVAVYEIQKEEAIDIDDYYDWWLAEKTLLRKKICFHVIGSRAVGLGHVYRALTLADRMIDHELRFVVSEENDLAIQKICSNYYNVTVCAQGKELDTILHFQPELCISDILNTDINYTKKLKQAGIKNIHFEDLGEGSLFADAVINSIYNYHPYLKNGTIFQGVQYCCLRDEFLFTKPKDFSQKVKNILILFGGTDPHNITGTVLNWLDRIPGDWTITVILGLGYSKLEKLVEITTKSQHKIEIIKDTTLVSKYMNQADLAITAAGRTVFELAALGVPMLTISSSQRELSHYFAHHSFGTISLGLWQNITRERFQNSVKELIQSNLMRQKMRQSLLNENLQNSINNVLNVINLVLTNSDIPASHSLAAVI